MALEVIRTIKDTEEKAEEIIKKATADARDQSKLDEKENEEFFEKKVLEASNQAKEILAKYEALAAAGQQEMKAEMELKISETRANAQKNMDEAVKYVLGRLA